jgi:Fe-S cluster assembly iron-binding protein IscA
MEEFLREDYMFQVSERAAEMLKEFFKEREAPQPIRIAIYGGG